MNETTIRGGGNEVKITVLGYERESAIEVSDANWLKARIAIRVGPFNADYEAALTTHDFVEFTENLAKVTANLEGQAAFRTDEDWLSLDVELNKRGAATVQGIAKVHGSPSASLSVRFDTDQSYLSQTLAECRQIVRNFPVRPITTDSPPSTPCG